MKIIHITEDIVGFSRRSGHTPLQIHFDTFFLGEAWFLSPVCQFSIIDWGLF